MSDPLYQAAILLHARHPHHQGRLGMATTHSAVRDNPLCGDRVTFDLALDSVGTVHGVAQQVRGCALCQAAASMLAETLLGQNLNVTHGLQAAVAEMFQGGAPAPAPFDVFAPVTDVPSRQSCVLLPFETVLAAAA